MIPETAAGLTAWAQFWFLILVLLVVVVILILFLFALLEIARW